MVPDELLSPEQNAAAAQRLGELSERLAKLLPDPSLSPMERLERFVRVTDAAPREENLRSAADKLDELLARIDELVPDDREETLSAEAKIEALVELVDQRVPDAPTLAAKLEKIGDPRVPEPPEA